MVGWPRLQAAGLQPEVRAHTAVHKQLQLSNVVRRICVQLDEELYPDDHFVEVPPPARAHTNLPDTAAVCSSFVVVACESRIARSELLLSGTILWLNHPCATGAPIAVG